MIPELGHFALIMALAVAIVQGVLPIAGAQLRLHGWMAVAAPAAQAQFLFLLVSFVCLSASFLASDFSVLYVATNSNERLPDIYKLSAVWGAHEGSLLLWALVLGGWTAAVTLASGRLPMEFRARVIGVMGLISVGFLLFMLVTSNPFDRLIPPPPQGRDLNPLLQDPGLIVHPPLLYMGYVGLAVPFAFAIAALLDGRLDAAWTRWTRPWTTVAWVFLTAGITLGSWWAYYELGWGGWWFWDPVENASFMPWLVATALIHSLAVTEKRGAFRAWTVLLAIFGFSLSLLGTFLVRSGVLVSVHAFATDPERGVFILAFLLVVIGSALALFAIRASQVVGGGRFDFVSRETLLLINNVLLVVACGSVLLGTMYPLIADATGMGKVSVGEPWFNAVFVPLMLPLVFLVGIGPLLRWKRDTLGRMARRLSVTFALAVVLAIALAVLVLPSTSIMLTLSLALAFWVTFTSFKGIAERLRNRSNKLRALLSLPLDFHGMVLAHVGVAVFIVGVAMVGAFEVEKDVSLRAGDSYEMAGLRFEFTGVSQVAGPNYTAQRGEVRVYDQDRLVTVLHPEKRNYPIQEQPMTEAAIEPGVTRDIYVALGEPLGDGAWAVRLYIKPFVRWIWWGPLLMVIGGLLSAADRRYRLAPRTASQSAPSASSPALAAGAE